MTTDKKTIMKRAHQMRKETAKQTRILYTEIELKQMTNKLNDFFNWNSPDGIFDRMDLALYEAKQQLGQETIQEMEFEFNHVKRLVTFLNGIHSRHDAINRMLEDRTIPVYDFKLNEPTEKKKKKDSKKSGASKEDENANVPQTLPS